MLQSQWTCEVSMAVFDQWLSLDVRLVCALVAGAVVKGVV